MKLTTYSHRNGERVIPSKAVSGVTQALEGIGWQLHRNCARRLREDVLRVLTGHGWSNRVQITARLKLTLTAVNVKTGLCLQTGNMARFYADLLKLQLAFEDDNIESAIYVLPTHDTSKVMGSNMAAYERLIRELAAFKNIITIPMLVVGFAQ